MDYYNKLKSMLLNKNILVIDRVSNGFVVQPTNLYKLIYVKHPLLDMEKVVVLAHEMGHIAYLKGGKLRFYKVHTNEEKANSNAVKLMKFVGVNEPKRVFRNVYKSLTSKEAKFI